MKQLENCLPFLVVCWLLFANIGDVWFSRTTYYNLVIREDGTRIDLDGAFRQVKNGEVEWRKINGENLRLDYTVLFRKSVAEELFAQLEESVEYYDGELTKVKVFGRWHRIPRQQAAYGDEGTKYHFSGVTLAAKNWTPQLEALRNLIASLTGVCYNFVLVNRYKDGNDHIGEHKDSEPELDKNAPIASVSLGQPRQFVLKHEDSRKKSNGSKIATVKINLEHGSLLLMQPPTNRYWYHSIPVRKNARGVRINLTFRKIILQR